MLIGEGLLLARRGRFGEAFDGGRIGSGLGVEIGLVPQISDFAREGVTAAVLSGNSVGSARAQRATPRAA